MVKESNMKYDKHKHFSPKNELSRRDIERLNNEVLSKKMKFHKEDLERLKKLEENKIKK